MCGNQGGGGEQTTLWPGICAPRLCYWHLEATSDVDAPSCFWTPKLRHRPSRDTPHVRPGGRDGPVTTSHPSIWLRICGNDMGMVPFSSSPTPVLCDQTLARATGVDPTSN
ncbi:hypothetical protein LIA77_06761 [Sarocladium implicatum]|nr:hypothetical protein LIA77_06761 [Sarocladium implicatum]